MCSKDDANDTARIKLGLDQQANTPLLLQILSMFRANLLNQNWEYAQHGSRVDPPKNERKVSVCYGY